jgi:non-ribosomal peptide synthetase component F
MYPGKWAEVFPDKAAVIHAVTGEVLSYRALNDRSNRLAQLMRAEGLRPGDQPTSRPCGRHSVPAST